MFAHLWSQGLQCEEEGGRTDGRGHAARLVEGRENCLSWAGCDRGGFYLAWLVPLCVTVEKDRDYSRSFHLKRKRWLQDEV